MRFLIAAGALLLTSCPLQAGPLRQALRRALPVQIPHIIRLPRASANTSDPAAQALLRRMLQAENSLALSGDQVTLVVQNGLDISSEQQVQRDGARSLRLDYLRPIRLAGEQIIDNGRFYCHLVPSKDMLELSPSRIQTLQVRVPEVIQQIRSGQLIVQQVGEEAVAGHNCGIIQVIARSSTPVPYRKFWVDLSNGAQLRIEQYDVQGQLQSASYYTQVTYNPVFDKAAFRLPSSGKVITNGFAAPTLTLDQVQAQAGFVVQVPSALPQGFHYQGGSVSDKRSYRVAELRYFNGANSLSVFETPDKLGGEPAKVQHPRRGVLFGRQGGLKVVIIANLGNAELDAVLASLK
ncbi:MAG: sigma-E factor regulatory protein RseB domain-containing protein [Janthinobacterium lividum]